MIMDGFMAPPYAVGQEGPAFFPVQLLRCCRTVWCRGRCCRGLVACSDAAYSHAHVRWSWHAVSRCGICTWQAAGDSWYGLS